MGAIQIPFSKPVVLGTEGEWVKEAFANSRVAGDGPFSARCSELLEDAIGASRVLLTTSCTHALEMAALLLDIKPGDKVLVPSFTFVSTVNAFVLRGGQPVFVDSRPDTLNMDEELVKELIDEQTRVVVPVHYGGVACEMDAILSYANDRGVRVVEDNAHGLFGAYRGRPLGSLGCMATQSFHESKNFSCGEGGALVINEPGLVSRAEIIREKGTDRSRFFRGEVDKYRWIDIGSSFLLADVLAALLLPQLERQEQITQRRMTIWQSYERSLAAWAADTGATLPVTPPHCDHPAHVFYLLMPDQPTRDRFIAHMRAQGILTVFHYLPLNMSPMGERLGGRRGMCPVAEDISGRIVRMPLYYNMGDDELAKVIECATQFKA